MSSRSWIFVGALLGGLSVALGAFAAHGLDQIFVKKYRDQVRVVGGESIPLARKFLNDFKTGAEYQMTHSLAILAVGLASQSKRQRSLNCAGWAFTIG
ncbi:MAG: DUF423 domain-containing protein, partial [Planctomycetes bacterium]|nr:DUF423 domain-containing protein [Planctomycetota bacterium]